jgi:membrane protein implicated in regulation of membrane protease activity
MARPRGARLGFLGLAHWATHIRPMGNLLFILFYMFCLLFASVSLSLSLLGFPRFLFWLPGVGSCSVLLVACSAPAVVLKFVLVPLLGQNKSFLFWGFIYKQDERASRSTGEGSGAVGVRVSTCKRLQTQTGHSRLVAARTKKRVEDERVPDQSDTLRHVLDAALLRCYIRPMGYEAAIFAQWAPSLSLSR